MELADKRYTVTREYCGHAKPQWVARFCGEWIGSGKYKSDALMHVVAHRDARELAMQS